jgi:hypothetical protein
MKKYLIILPLVLILLFASRCDVVSKPLIGYGYYQAIVVVDFYWWQRMVVIQRKPGQWPQLYSIEMTSRAEIRRMIREIIERNQVRKAPKETPI